MFAGTGATGCLSRPRASAWPRSAPRGEHLGILLLRLFGLGRPKAPRAAAFPPNAGAGPPTTARLSGWCSGPAGPPRPELGRQKPPDPRSCRARICTGPRRCTPQASLGSAGMGDGLSGADTEGGRIAPLLQTQPPSAPSQRPRCHRHRGVWPQCPPGNSGGVEAVGPLTEDEV